MNRRSFLQIKQPTATLPRVTSGIEPYTGAFDISAKRHLLRRCLFSIKKSDVTALDSLTLSQAIDLVMTPTDPGKPIAYNKVGNVALGDTWVNEAYNSGVDGTQQSFLQSWWIHQILLQKISLTEKMVMFWHNHTPSGWNSVKDARFMWKQQETIRKHAFGNLKTLLTDITLDPAMLRYLSGSTNTKQSPNENYGRELQELFTVGKGPERAPGDYTNYTEADVKMVARVLTGWKEDSAQQKATFVVSAHDQGDKIFSSSYQNTVIKGGKDEAGARRELDELLSMLLRQKVTAELVVRKLYRWFVDYVIDTDVETNVIQPLVSLYQSGSYEIAPVLRTLLSSAHFFDSAKRACCIKTPAEIILGTFRTLRCDDAFPDASNIKQGAYRMGTANPVSAHHWSYRAVRRTMQTLGQDFFNPPNVAGFNAYYQVPDFHEWWINTDTLQKRVQFTNELAQDGYQFDEAYYKSTFNYIAILDSLDDPLSADDMIVELTDLLFAMTLAPEQLADIKAVLLNSLPGSAWAEAWKAFNNDRSDDVAKNNLIAMFSPMLKYMLAMAEYQLQ